MSLRLQMTRAAAAAVGRWPEGARRVSTFVGGQFNADGGCRNRGGQSDLYYTTFALQSLQAVGAEAPERVGEYLDGFGRGGSLGLVDLACLARCWACLGGGPPGDARESMLARLARWRTGDGGYCRDGGECGSVFDAFFVCGAQQDLGATLPDPLGVAASLETCRSADGGYGNVPSQSIGSTPATAAAVTLLCEVDAPVPAGACDWLLARAVPGGGFCAASLTPFPDLLSSAVALHALSRADADFSATAEACAQFVLGLRSDFGGFFAHGADDAMDCEFTFYGLLALGHLSG